MRETSHGGDNAVYRLGRGDQPAVFPRGSVWLHSWRNGQSIFPGRVLVLFAALEVLFSLSFVSETLFHRLPPRTVDYNRTYLRLKWRLPVIPAQRICSEGRKGHD